MRRTDRQLTNHESLIDILTRADCCHLALVDGTRPYIVTMNFGYSWEGEFPVLYIHGARQGRKIDILSSNPEVCFSMDLDHQLVTGEKACGFGMRYKSLVGYATASFVDDTEEKGRGLELLLRKFSSAPVFEYDPKVMAVTQVIRLDVTELKGKEKP